MIYQILNERSRELRTVELMGVTGPGPLVIFRVPPVHVSMSDNGTYAAAIHIFSLNSGRSPGAMKEWVIAKDSWERLVTWWREEHTTKVTPRYKASKKKPVRKPKKADPRQGDLF